MTLDSWLVARLAAELDGSLRGSRVQLVAGDERSLVVECFRRGARVDLRVSLDPETPLVALAGSPDKRQGQPERGWLHGIGGLLRNALVERVHALEGDRVLFVDLRSRSAFGVEARYRLIIELEPRKSNVLVVKPAADGVLAIVAAAKQFDGGDGGRAVRVGQRYEPPPPRHASLSPEAFGAALAAQGENSGARSVVRLLGMVDPSCTPPLARELLVRAARPEDALRDWPQLRSEVSAAAAAGAPVFVAMRGEVVTACHLVPLTWAGATQRRPSMVEVCAAALEAAERRRRTPAIGALRALIERAATRADEEALSLRRALETASAADALRAAGDAIYANLAAIEPHADSLLASDGSVVKLDPRLSAKENAARYFQRYKKSRAGVPHMQRRLAQLRARREFADYALWELDRTQSAEHADARLIVSDIRAALAAAGLAPKQPATPAKKTANAKSADRASEIRYDDGSAIYVGRSPKDNERVTFSVAGPDDLWFHARNTPGAHVILKSADSRRAPPEDRIHAAAVLAAKHSRGADATRVEVDYTQRKHVRRQGAGRTGLVWYTNAKTIAVDPRAPG